MRPDNTAEARRAASEAVALLPKNPTCTHCTQPLECVEQNRRTGTWLGLFMCANCRSEYFYSYRWGRLIPKA